MKFSSKNKVPYREKLVAQIQRAGQELIDRAETMVSPGCDLISDFRIEIDFPLDLLPTIKFSTSVINRTEAETIIAQQQAVSHDD